eukprot:gene3292-13316_t
MKRASGGIGGSSYSDAQQKRRQEALARQKAARRQQFVQIARIPDDVEESGDTSMGTDLSTSTSTQGGSSSSHVKARGSRGRRAAEGDEHPKVFSSRQLMVPEWLTDVPHDLRDKW